MTRKHFEKVFLENYEAYTKRLCTKGGGYGLDILHQCFSNILEHGTYKRGPRLHAKRWIYWKISRELVRDRKAKRLRDTKTWEARDSIIGAMQERETMERPDIGLMVKELEPKGKTCG